MKKKFIIMGTGNRGVGCFGKGIKNVGGKGRDDFVDNAEIVAFVDTNLTRAAAGAKEIGMPDLPIFKTIEEAQHIEADWCIVTTPDYTHCDAVCRTLRAGINCLVDKPLATSSQECQMIIDCMEETGREVIVGHNMRYNPDYLKAAHMLRDGIIGDVLSIESAEVLDYSHGGDYFHRWHSDFSKSAGMMTHKGCHFIDVMNWLLDDEPVKVSAIGARNFYKPRPDLDHAERCLDCNLSESCKHYFHMDKWDGIWTRLYQAAEKDDGYIRDLCVFSDRHTVNDQENLIITYKKGTQATFSLITFGSKEFTYYFINGTKGRLEIGSNPMGEKFFRVVDVDGNVEEQETTKGSGEHGHGGSDMRLIAHIIGLDELDPMVRAYPIEGKRAVDVADMAARSIALGGAPVTIDDIGKDYPPAPGT